MFSELAIKNWFFITKISNKLEPFWFIRKLPNCTIDTFFLNSRYLIVNNLNKLDETERPVHCADKKREICYIKDEGKWEKDEDKKKIKQIIKKVAYKNERLLPLFKEEYPDYNDSESIRSDQYSKIVIETMGGVDGNPSDKEDKIIKNITKAASINKYL